MNRAPTCSSRDGHNSDTEAKVQFTIVTDWEQTQDNSTDVYCSLVFINRVGLLFNGNPCSWEGYRGISNRTVNNRECRDKRDGAQMKELEHKM